MRDGSRQIIRALQRVLIFPDLEKIRIGDSDQGKARALSFFHFMRILREFVIKAK